MKNWAKKAWPRSRDLLLNFGTPLLSPVRMKIQKSNFAGGLWLRVLNKEIKMANQGIAMSRDALLMFGTHNH